jgi:hypothetical protein
VRDLLECDIAKTDEYVMFRDPQTGAEMRNVTAHSVAKLRKFVRCGSGSNFRKWGLYLQEFVL